MVSVCGGGGGGGSSEFVSYILKTIWYMDDILEKLLDQYVTEIDLMKYI